MEPGLPERRLEALPIQSQCIRSSNHATGIPDNKTKTYPLRKIAPFATRYCSLFGTWDQFLRPPADIMVDLWQMIESLPVFANRNTSVVLPNIGWSLEPVLLLRRQFHLDEDDTYQISERANLRDSEDCIRTFSMYDCGAMPLETSDRRARPYCAAPRTVAVSQSEGRAITLIREPNIS